MKCPICGYTSVNNDDDICPNCKNNIASILQESSNSFSNVNEVNANADVVSQVNSEFNYQHDGISENEENSKEEKEKSNIVYFLILIIVVLVFFALGFLVFKRHLQESKNVSQPRTTLKSTESLEKVMTKNRGVYSGLGAPVQIGEVTYGGLLDKETNQQFDADVQVLRHLNNEEIQNIISSSQQTLNEGFTWDGVEYRVTLNDFAYLGDKTLNPTMKTYLFDEFYKNNFFLVNEKYYTVEPISADSLPIKNGESASLRVAYQVPINQNYYVCFGENLSSLGCFKN